MMQQTLLESTLSPSDPLPSAATHSMSDIAAIGMSPSVASESLSEPCAWSGLFHPELIVAAAFTKGHFRVPLQLAEALDRPLSTILGELSGWMRQETWCAILKEFAKDIGVSHYIYNGHRLIEFETRDSHHHRLVFNVWAGHIYVYKNASKYAECDARHHPSRKLGAPKPIVMDLNDRIVTDPITGDETVELDDMEILAGRKAHPRWSLVKEDKHISKCVEEYKPFPWDQAETDMALVPPGMYWVRSMKPINTDTDDGRDIEGVLSLFAEGRRFPRVSMVRYKDRNGLPLDKPHELRYTKVAGKDDAASGDICVRSHALDSAATAQWARKLNVPYAGQSLGTFTGIVLDRLLSARCRRYLTDVEKRQLLSDQGRQCSSCGDVLTDQEAVYDHTIPLHEMTSDQSLDAFQVICGQCSANKSVSESRACLGVLKSRFNKRLHNEYLKSPKPPCMTYRDVAATELGTVPRALDKRVSTSMAVDVIRCRYMALYNAVYLPVFCAIDDIELVSPERELPDQVFIEKPHEVANINDILAALPYRGPGWYSRPAVEFLLHTRKMGWDDLLYGVTASGRIEGDIVRAALDQMTGAWEGITFFELQRTSESTQ